MRLALPLAAVLGGFCFRLTSIGFYNDDYAWLEMWRQAPSQTPWGVAAHWAQVHAAQWFRPGTLAFHPLEFWLFGPHPLPYQLLLLAVHLATAALFFRFLENEGAEPGSAAFAAAAVALYPNHDATRHWACLTGAPLAMALTLAALVLYRRWQKGAGTAILATALALFGFGTLLYEAAALLALLPLFLSWRERVQTGEPPAKALAAVLPESAPILGLLAAIVLYQRVLVPHWLIAERHPVSVSPAHALKVLSAGLECTIANRLLHVIARSAQYAWASFHALDWLLFAAAAAALVWLVGAVATERTERGSGTLLPSLGAALFVLGYAPYFLDATYTPVVFAQVNRINAVGSLGGACWLAWLFERNRTWAPRFCAALLAAFLLSCWGSNAQWADAYGLQQRVLERLRPKLGPPGAPRTILLYGLPDSLGSATVFQSTYDFDAALRLATGDAALKGLVGQNRVRFQDDAAILVWFGESPIPYDSLYAFDFPTGRLSRIPDRAAGLAFLSSLGPKP